MKFRKADVLVNLIILGVDFSCLSPDRDLKYDVWVEGNVVRDLFAAETLDGGDGSLTRAINESDIEDLLSSYYEEDSGQSKNIASIFRKL